MTKMPDFSAEYPWPGYLHSTYGPTYPGNIANGVISSPPDIKYCPDPYEQESEQVSVADVESMTLILYMKDGSKSTIVVPNPTELTMTTTHSTYAMPASSSWGDVLAAASSTMERLTFSTRPKPDPKTGGQYTLKIDNFQTPPQT